MMFSEVKRIVYNDVFERENSVFFLGLEKRSINNTARRQNVFNSSVILSWVIKLPKSPLFLDFKSFNSNWYEHQKSTKKQKGDNNIGMLSLPQC